MEGVSHARRLANILHFLCPPHFLPFLPLPCPLSLSRPRVTLQKAPSTKERTRPETLNPITIDHCALRGEKCAYLHAHAQICLDTESPVRSGMVCVRSWSVIQSNQGSKKENHVRKFPGYLLFFSVTVWKHSISYTHLRFSRNTSLCWVIHHPIDANKLQKCTCKPSIEQIMQFKE